MSNYKTYFIEVPLPLIQEDQRYPNRDTRHIYDHLRYFCSKVFPLPAIDVVLDNGKLIVIRGHQYARAARELGYPWLRAAYKSQVTNPQAVLDELPLGVKVIPQELLAQESETAVSRDHHVYFFDGALTLGEKDRFLSDIAGFFEGLETPLIGKSEKRLLKWDFPFGGHCGEFEALIPVGDPTWVEAYLDTCRKFSRQVRRIVSFQGARFPE